MIIAFPPHEQDSVESVDFAVVCFATSSHELFHIPTKPNQAMSQTIAWETVAQTVHKQTANTKPSCMSVIFSDLPSVAIVQCGISASSILFKSNIRQLFKGQTKNGIIIYEAGRRSTDIIVHRYPCIYKRQCHRINGRL